MTKVNKESPFNLRDSALEENMKKVIVIEDQTIMRDLICQLVEGYAAMEVVASSGDGAEGYDL